MNQDLNEQFSQAQQERLFHIDFKLRFFGVVNRSDLVECFGIKGAAATRDLGIYKDLAPDNLSYDAKCKSYVQSEHFVPMYECTQSQALAALMLGLGDDCVSLNKLVIATEAPTELNLPQLDVLAKITQAIFQQKALKIQYFSLSSGQTSREIVPFALVDNGLRWHVRAFDRKRNIFTDFVINRIAKPKLLSQSPVVDSETREADIQWNRIVEMHLVPHPQLRHPATIEFEYGMVKGMLKVNARAAVAGYILRRWNVDCSSAHALVGGQYHLWLQNRQTLYGVENLVIAPGYEPDA